MRDRPSPAVVFARAAWGRAYVRVVGLNRELSWIVGDTILPVLGTAAYLLAYRSLGAPRDFEGFVVLGGAMTAYWLNVLWSLATQLHWEKESGNLEIAISSPCTVGALLAGMALGGLVSTTLRAAAIVAAGALAFGVRFDLSAPGLAGAAFLGTLAALYALGAAASSIFLVYGRAGWQVAMLFQEPVYLLSGFYFPVSRLGRPLAMAASILPLTLGLDALRQTACPGGRAEALFPPAAEVAALVVLAVVFGLLARAALRTFETRARREGRLTLRWQ